MIRLFPLLVLAFKVWMLIDAAKKHVAYYWYPIIFFIPFGGVAYFIVIKSGDYDFKQLFTRPVTLKERRYRYENSPSLENRIELAQALVDGGEAEEALGHFEEILERYLDNTEALYGAGVSRAARGDHGVAAGHFRRLVDKQPGYRDYVVWKDLAEALWEDGKREESLEAVREINKFNPRVDHQLLLAQCLVSMKQEAEARKLVDDALTDFKHSPAYVKRSYGASASRLRKLRREL